jgi:hypothetical protein
MSTINQSGHASNFCQTIKSCAQMLPTKPKDSISEETAPIFVRIGQRVIDKIATTAIKPSLNLVVSFLGFAPFGPHPSHPHKAPAIKTNCKAALA